MYLFYLRGFGALKISSSTHRPEAQSFHPVCSLWIYQRPLLHFVCLFRFFSAAKALFSYAIPSEGNVTNTGVFSLLIQIWCQIVCHVELLHFSVFVGKFVFRKEEKGKVLWQQFFWHSEILWSLKRPDLHRKMIWKHLCHPLKQKMI